MIKYYSWALAERILSLVPYGKKFYHTVGYILKKDSLGKSVSFTSSFPLIKMGKKLLKDGGTVLDVGTGWFHHDAFLLYLVGDCKIYLFDIEDKAKIDYVKNYLNNLLGNADLISKELSISSEVLHNKIEPLLKLQRLIEIYDYCNFVPCITSKTDKPFLPENTFDFMISNCVINHIPLKLLIPELKSLRYMLKKDGYMYFHIGHDDHWSFHDRSANTFNYYRYSDFFYKILFESFEFQNRFVKQEWLKIFEECELKVIEYNTKTTEESKNEILKLPHIDSRFAKYPIEELSIIYSYVLLQKK